MCISDILKRAIHCEELSVAEGTILYEQAPLSQLIFVANELRKHHVPGQKVTWQIDRNVNITNVCIAGCKFCNFHCGLRSSKAYITSIKEYRQKIDEMLYLGGNQLLLQGGLHPKLGLEFYTSLFSELKQLYPDVNLHALGPPEIAHIARLEGMTYKEVLVALVDAGLGSLPGGGAEILVDRVRRELSPGKPDSKAWLDVMAEAHKLGLLTSATMMFGHIETIEERMEHLVNLRNLQNHKPKDTIGFSAFICWPYQGKRTKLERMGVGTSVTTNEYVRMVTLGRIMLPNIRHIQASWLTTGVEAAQLCLHAGADDMGSIMIEENVVSAAGSSTSLDAKGMQRVITEAGFIPQLRDQAYNSI
ncbi:MAG: CofH family radical SAM protein [Bacteroidales bacterium]